MKPHRCCCYMPSAPLLGRPVSSPCMHAGVHMGPGREHRGIPHRQSRELPDPWSGQEPHPLYGWRARILCDGKPAFGPWTKKEDYLHINCLEMLAVWLGLCPFLPDPRGHHILFSSDSMMVVSYINHQGGSFPEVPLYPKVPRWEQRMCRANWTWE